MPNEVNANYYSYTVKDFSKEKSVMEFNIDQFTDNATYLAAQSAFETALNSIIDGNPQQRSVALTNRFSNAPAASASSAREKKGLIRYEDTTTFKQYVVSIPTLDDTAVTFIENTDFIDLGVGDAPAFVNAFETFALSPAGNPVNVISIERVGRNN